ncbi:uncharacterized protein LOC123270144 [Cotesia glomerata]|uniref:uncharacterized protein LOC123270144 n=1 Tax=Cotesia glomerata TaxID=32391 RepID=UPI001D02361F|nr:uncharacterized protein LOC123270144 [Cotesia glomerata]
MSKLNDFETEIIKLTLSLYGNFAIPRSGVQTIIHNIDELIANTYVPRLEREILSIIQNKCNKEVIDDVESILRFYKHPFEFVNSEHQRFALYEKQFGFLLPQEYIVGYTRVSEIQENALVEKTEPVYAVHIPLRHTLATFLRLPLGNSWRERSRHHENEIVVPIHMYEDDVKTGNALGSHAGRNKLGAVYALLPCLPPHLLSRLNNIFLVSVFYSDDRKIYGNKSIFNKVSDDLNDLIKKRIEITIGYPCRICSMPIETLRNSTSEDPSLLPNPQNYEVDVKKNNYSVTGIKEECVFHRIKNYHITENPAVDIMHDVHEDSGSYAMRKIFYQLVVEDQVILYETLVDRMETFPYGPTESGKKPPMIKLKHLKENKMLKMSASEMGCFIRYFGLMFGHLVPRDNTIWPSYLVLRRIFDIITALSLLRNDAVTLKDLDTQYKTLYLKFVGYMTFKSHMMSYYSQLSLRNEPLVHHWSMRCESKHRDLTIPAVTTSSLKNLLVTVATRDQLKATYLSIFGDFNSNILKVKSKNNDEDNDKAKRKFFPLISPSDIQLLDHVVYNGHTYQSNTVVLVQIDESEDRSLEKFIKFMQ